MGFVEITVLAAIFGTIVTTFGMLSFVSVMSGVRRDEGPRLLGVCYRLSRQFNLPVGGLRILVALITLLTGILPGVIVYLVSGIVMAWCDGPLEGSLPGFAATDRGPVLLGVCRRFARRLDVPAGRVRLLVVIAAFFTGVVPGLLLYCLAAFLHTEHGRRNLGRFAHSLDELRRDVAGADDRLASWSPAPAGPGRIGRYRILGEVGRGGMGTVYHGRDEALHRDAAVKVIRPAPGADAEALKRFGEEARAAASLASPHIVQVYEFEPASNPPFLAMELVPGMSVQRMLKGSGALPLTTVIDCASQILAGLDTAHAAGIVHRDIKPANILLATTGPAAGTYKLTDFGLALSPDRQHTLTASGALLGTLTYLAPEVALGGEASASSDLYSLGASLHEMLTGRPAHAADSPLKLLRRITTEPIPSLLESRPDIPAEFAAWLDRLLAPSPSDRFASAAAAAAALAALPVAAGPAGANPGGSPPPLPDVPWHRRPFHAQGAGIAAGADGSAARILDRAAAMEAGGRDLLGEETITDIARELNLDGADVRAILLAHHRARGGAGRGTDSVAAMFGEALRRPSARPFDGADLWNGHATTASLHLPRSRRKLAPVAVAIGAALAAALLIGGVRTVRIDVSEMDRPDPPEPKVVFVESESSVPPRHDPGSAEAAMEPEGATISISIDHSPQAAPSSRPAPTRPGPEQAATPQEVFRKKKVAIPTSMGIVLICVLGVGLASLVRTFRRRHARN